MEALSFSRLTASKAHSLGELPCGHQYCCSCMTNWVKDQNTCPGCRCELYRQEDEYGETALERDQALERGFEFYDYSEEEYNRLLSVFQNHVRASKQPTAAVAMHIKCQGQTPSMSRLDVKGIITQNSDGEHEIDEKSVRYLIRHKVKLAGETIWRAWFE